MQDAQPDRLPRMESPGNDRQRFWKSVCHFLVKAERVRISPRAKTWFQRAKTFVHFHTYFDLHISVSLRNCTTDRCITQPSFCSGLYGALTPFVSLELHKPQFGILGSDVADGVAKPLIQIENDISGWVLVLWQHRIIRQGISARDFVPNYAVLP